MHFAGGASCHIIASPAPGSLPAARLSWMFPPPTAGLFPLDEGFCLSPALFSDSTLSFLCWVRKLDLVVGKGRKVVLSTLCIK